MIACADAAAADVVSKLFLTGADMGAAAAGVRGRVSYHLR